MSKKKINNRLDKLFDEIKHEETATQTRGRASNVVAQAKAKKESAKSGSSATTPTRRNEPLQTIFGDQKVLPEVDYPRSSSVLSMAFRTAQSSWATLKVVDETEERVWGMEEQMLVKQVADQLSLALENARLFQEAQRRAQEMTAIAEIGREISATLELQTVLERIATRAKETLDAVTSAVYIPDANFQVLKAIAVVGEEADEIREDPLNIGQGILGNIALRKVGEIVNNVSIDPRAITIQGTDNVIDEHLMAAPILSQDTLNGLLAIWRVGPGEGFTKTEFEFLESLAQQASIAVENARLFDETQKRSEELAAINEIISLASQTLDLKTNLAAVLEQVLEVTGFDGGLITMFNETRGRLERAVRIGMPGQTPADPAQGLDNSLCEMVFRTGKVLTINDLRTGTPEGINAKGDIEAGLRGYIGIPIQTKGQTLGTLCIFRYSSEEIAENIISLSRTIGSQLGFTIENALLFSQTLENREQLTEALRIARMGYFDYDRRTETMTLTDELFELLKTTAEEEGGYQLSLEDALQKFLFAEDIPQAQSAAQDLLNNPEKEQLTKELRFITKDGQSIWVETIFKAAQDEQGQYNKILGSCQDITERKLNEIAVQLSEERNRLLVESAPEAILVIDVETGLFTEPNENATKLYGLSREDLLEVGPADMSPEFQPDGSSSTEVAKENISQALAGEIVVFEWIHKNAQSKEFPCEIRLVRLPGDKPRVRATVTDITDRKKVQEDLVKFKLGIEQTDSAVFITDVNGIIQYANPGFEKIYGFTLDEVIGQTPRILKSGVIPQEQYQGFWNTLLNKGTVTGEIVNKTKDGRFIPIAGTNSPILDERGDILGFLAVHSDITERKQNEETLRRRNEYLAASAEIGRLVTSTLDLNVIFTRTVNLIVERFGYYYASIFLLDESGFNAVLQEATGHAGEEMKAKRHSLAVGSKSIVGAATNGTEPVIVNNVVGSELHKPNPFLPETQAEAAIPLRVGERLIGAIDIQSTETEAFSEDDISVLRLLADQVAIAIDNARSYNLSQQAVTEMREIDKLKSQFLANMSHELRTPLNSIIGFARVILKGIDGPITELQQQDLTAIFNSGQHLLGLINDILDLSRIEAGKMELTFDEVNLSDLITSVMSTAIGLIKDRPIELKREIDEELPLVRADAMRVRQVLINLLSNASKFTEEGSITVKATTGKGPNGHPEVVISVTDTGPGIAEEDQEKLFKAFSQVDASLTRKVGGTGLGLSICSNLIQMHGGRIDVDSAPGKGSTFFFTLPIYRGKGDVAGLDETKVILAIDDDPGITNLYERYLQPQGYQVIALNDPSRAKERVRQLKPFAVTLDIMMPGIDGWQILNDLKSDLETRDTPVIICSIVEDEEKGFSLGAADYLVKPIMEDDLLNSLDRLNGDGSIREVLVIDDDPNDLRLLGKMLSNQGRYKPVLAEGGKAGWDIITTDIPHAIILDLFMPDLNGFSILEQLRENPSYRDIPVIVISGADLTADQQKQLTDLGQRMLQKGTLKEKELISTIENALKRVKADL